MATKIAKKINQWFVRYASEHIISIDEDDDGLYCEVISESNDEQTYNVHCDESGLVPVATSCKCEGHANGYVCKHMQAANLFWARIYKSNLEKVAAKQEVATVTEEPTYYDKDQCCRCYVATRQPVDPEAQQAAIKAQNEKVTDLSTKGNFGSKPFSLLAS